MSFTLNITFIIEPGKETELLNFIRHKMIPSVFPDNSGDRNVQIKKLVEVGGKAPEPDHGLSIALSADFPTRKEVRDWEKDYLTPALKEFYAEFGSEALYFVTLLENLVIL